MDYILTGNDKDVANVLQEQRIRIGRGVISFIPVSECRLITEEDARKTLENTLAEKNEEIGKLIASIAEKDNIINELTSERDAMKTRIEELESSLVLDDKNLPKEDAKDLPIEDTKELSEDDSKDLSVVDEKYALPETKKKVGRPKIIK